MKYAWHLRWVVPLVLVGFVVWEGLGATSALTAETLFQSRTPYVDVLQPAGRVTRTSGGVVINQEPVYIDVRLPVRAQAVNLELELVQVPPPDLTVPSTYPRLGVQTAEGFAFTFMSDSPSLLGNTLYYRFPVAQLPYVRAGHVVRFIISVPSLTSHAVTVQSARVTVTREPLSLVWISAHISKLVW